MFGRLFCGLNFSFIFSAYLRDYILLTLPLPAFELEMFLAAPV